MTITLHRPNQIGGCITEIVSSTGTKIIVDLGHKLPRGDEEAPDEYASPGAVAELTKGASAIFYTHMHGDHVELFHYVPDGIDQYIGPLARNIMIAKYDHMSHAREQQVKEDCLSRIKKLEAFKTYHKGWSIRVGDITVVPFQVSHSSADSYMLLIKCDGKTILHTGDFRGHGYMGEGIYKVVDKFHIAGHVDVLITEGTNVDNKGKSVRPESALKEDFKKVFGDFKNNFILCSSTDADRLESIFSADRDGAKRPFFVDAYQKDLIGLISQQAEEKRRVYHFGGLTIYGYNPKVAKMEKLMRWKGFVMLIRNNTTFQKYLDEHILQFCKPEESCLVYSMYHGYIDKKMSAFQEKTYNFVEQFRKRGFAFEEIHTSGHASKQDLVRLCEQVNPGIIIPIHKDEFADFKKILPDELKLKVCEKNFSEDGLVVSFIPGHEV